MKISPSPVETGPSCGSTPGGQFRTGAASKNGHEVVIGTALMLTGENSRTVAASVREKFQLIRDNLPPGIVADVVLDRSQLVNATITTVGENLATAAISARSWTRRNRQSKRTCGSRPAPGSNGAANSKTFSRRSIGFRWSFRPALF
jgi:hypothetical protein